MKDAGVIGKYVKSIEWIRESLLPMDEMAHPILGIAAWDDAVCVSFGGRKLVVSSDGPYTKRLVLKSALIHAATDVVVKGARPLFATDTVVGPPKEVEAMIESLRRQAESMMIPILGGNTLFEDDAEPRCSITVAGELLLDEPIRDSTAREGDVIALIGEPVWGGQDERISKAKRLFDCWFEILGKGIEINSAKDVTKGGLASVVYEMEEKSGRKFRLRDGLPYPLTRNLDNFLVSVNEKVNEEIRGICESKKCSFAEVGEVI